MYVRAYSSMVEQLSYTQPVPRSSRGGRTRNKTRLFCLLVRDGAMFCQQTKPRVRVAEALRGWQISGIFDKLGKVVGARSV